MVRFIIIIISFCILSCNHDECQNFLPIQWNERIEADIFKILSINSGFSFVYVEENIPIAVGNIKESAEDRDSLKIKFYKIKLTRDNSTKHTKYYDKKFSLSVDENHTSSEINFYYSATDDYILKSNLVLNLITDVEKAMQLSSERVDESYFIIVYQEYESEWIKHKIRNIVPKDRLKNLLKLMIKKE